jgi:hypothetical protein
MAGGNKYHAKKAPCFHGHVHDSKGEAHRCNELHDDQSAGLISDIVVHPRYFFVIGGAKVMGANNQALRFTPDFAYLDNATGRTVVEDFKGFRTKDYGLRVAFFRALYPELDFRESRR